MEIVLLAGFLQRARFIVGDGGRRGIRCVIIVGDGGRVEGRVQRVKEYGGKWAASQ